MQTPVELGDPHIKRDVVVYVAETAFGAAPGAVLYAEEPDAESSIVPPVKVLFSGIPNSQTLVDGLKRAAQSVVNAGSNEAQNE